MIDVDCKDDYDENKADKIKDVLNLHIRLKMVSLNFRIPLRKSENIVSQMISMSNPLST